MEAFMSTTTDTPMLDPAIRSFYERRPEEDRLQNGAAQLEALRTRALIERFAPPTPAIALDVGGAAGAYALWLSESGYSVHLVDPVPRLIDVARRRSAAAVRPISSCTLGDARSLPFESSSADFALLLGPLYHLTSTTDRVRALREAARVLKPGGVLFAAAISRWASALDGLSRDLFADAVFYSIVEEDLRSGEHRNPTDRVDWFTTAYFHHPEQLREEVSEAGLDLEGVFGLEGPGWLYPDFAERWADPRRRADLVRIAESVERETEMLGISAHMLAVAYKPS
jgi:ubiquinone/menaquinone biosynthesis C-methylase UbiE